MGIVKVEIIAKDTIRPSSPTPHHLRRFDFSIFSQFAPCVYVPLLLFYAGTLSGEAEVEDISRRLKSSLSETLAIFYPFAGKIRDNICVDCTDDGADYQEARVTGTTIREILESPQLDVQRLFLPVDIDSTESFHGRLVSIQTSVFVTGGIAIGICLSHKLADTSILSSFLICWAALARGGLLSTGAPDFTVSTLFPPSECLTSLRPAKSPKPKCKSRRYCFRAEKIAALRARAASERAAQLTRVETLSAFIWKCAMAAASSSTHPNKSSVLAQTVNIRKRIEPPLAPNSVGSLLSYFTANFDETTTAIHNNFGPSKKEDLLPKLAAKIREGMQHFCGDFAKKLVGEGTPLVLESMKEAGDLVKGDGFSFYAVTSWCKFGLYEVDFGWGRPDWVSICSSEYRNVVVLTDARDGEGVEAWVTLSEEDMAVFERDPDLLQYATPDPSARPGTADG